MTSAAAAAAAAGNNASIYFKSIEESLVPVLALQFDILESLSRSPLLTPLVLNNDLRAVAADFQVPLRQMLLLEMTRDRASIGEHCAMLDGTLRSLTENSVNLKSALFRYQPPVQDDTSLDRMYKFNEQLAADFERFRDLASKAIFFGPPKLFKKVKNWWYGAGKEAESENKTKAAAATPPPPPPPPAAASTATAPAPAAPAGRAPAPSKGGKKKRRRNTESARS